MSSPMPFVPPSEQGAMCCICWEWRTVEDLHRDQHGDTWDICSLFLTDCAVKAGEL